VCARDTILTNSVSLKGNLPNLSLVGHTDARSIYNTSLSDAGWLDACVVDTDTPFPRSRR
jgi:hypothetical protein